MPHIDPRGEADSWLPYPRYLLRKHLVKKMLMREDTLDRKCLEVGYGSGDMLLLYARLGMEVYGYDYSSRAAANANKRIAKHRDLRRRITLCPTEADMQQRKYDYLMALEVLEHVRDDIETLRKWRGLLAQGGKIILSVPAHKHKWGASDVAVGHYRRYEKDELKDLCDQSGIAVRSIWCYGFPLTLLLDPLLHASKRDEVSRTATASPEDRSKTSGIDRRKNIVFRLLFNETAIYPFSVLQEPFLRTDWGSGYIMLGEAAAAAQR